MRRARAFLGAAGAAAAIAVPVAGCGSSGVDPAALAQAATATRQAGTSKVAMAVSIEGSQLPNGGSITITGAGASDMVHRRGHFGFDMSSLATLLGRDASQFRGEEVIDDHVLYMRFPFLEQVVGKPWMRVDLERLGGALGVDITQLSQGQGDPTQLLRFLRSMGDVQEVGTDAVRGAPTTHYKGRLRLDRLADSLPAGRRAATRRAIDRLTQAIGTGSLPLELWVDGSNRVRRMLMDMTVKASGQELHERINVELYDFGTPVRVTVPPASDTRDMTSLGLSALQGISR